MFKRIAILAAGLVVPAVIAVGATSPAFAANPQTVNVSVASEITFSGLQNITFANVSNNGVGVIGCPSGGCTSGAFGQTSEVFNINANDASGYTFSEAAGFAFFQGPAPSTQNVIPDTDWTIQGEDTTVGGSTAYGLGSPYSPTVAGQQLLKTTTGPSDDLFNETWTLTIPTTAAALAAGTYNNTLTYAAIGN